MYRFALRPRWILSHLFVLALVAGMITAGMWQLRRLDERRDRNDEVAARTELPPADVATLLDETSPTAVDDLTYRRAVATGVYDGDGVLIDNRSLDGTPGAWGVDPLVLDDGTVLAVNRGFARIGPDGTVQVPEAPSGPVTVDGYLVPFVDRTCPTRTDTDGQVVGTACLDEAAVEAAVGTDVLPVVLVASTSAPADADALGPVPLPEPGDGPHLSYAVQWFVFTTIALVGYPLILRRNARDRARADLPSEDDDDLDLELRRLLDEGRSTP